MGLFVPVVVYWEVPVRFFSQSISLPEPGQRFLKVKCAILRSLVSVILLLFHTQSRNVTLGVIWPYVCLFGLAILNSSAADTSHIHSLIVYPYIPHLHTR